jgi:hypothetical protein
MLLRSKLWDSVFIRVCNDESNREQKFVSDGRNNVVQGHTSDPTVPTRKENAKSKGKNSPRASPNNAKRAEAPPLLGSIRRSDVSARTQDAPRRASTNADGWRSGVVEGMFVIATDAPLPYDCSNSLSVRNWSRERLPMLWMTEIWPPNCRNVRHLSQPENSHHYYDPRRIQGADQVFTISWHEPMKTAFPIRKFRLRHLSYLHSNDHKV